MSGLVYLFKRNAGIYDFIDVITEPLAGSNDSFGKIVSIDENGSFLAVAPRLIENQSGRVEIFRRTSVDATLWA